MGSPSLESFEVLRTVSDLLCQILGLTGGEGRGDHPVFKTTFPYKLPFSIQALQIKTKREYKKNKYPEYFKGGFYRIKKVNCNTVNLQSERFYVEAAKAQRNICTSFHDF